MSTEPSGWRPVPRIRPIVVGIARRADAILVAAVCADDGTVKGWRPFGGGIELGEGSTDALIREFREELGARVEVGERLGVLENIYTHHGVVGHEVVFVYDVVLTEPGLASQGAFTYDEEGQQTGLRGEWRSLRGFQSGEDALFPEGLLGLLES